MSAHIHHEEKSYEDWKTHMSNGRGDHKHEDWDYPDHKEEDHIAHELGFINHGIHKHEDYLGHNHRLSFHTAFHHY